MPTARMKIPSIISFSANSRPTRFRKNLIIVASVSIAAIVNLQNAEGVQKKSGNDNQTKCHLILLIPNSPEINSQQRRRSIEKRQFMIKLKNNPGNKAEQRDGDNCQNYFIFYLQLGPSNSVQIIQTRMTATTKRNKPPRIYSMILIYVAATITAKKPITMSIDIIRFFFCLLVIIYLLRTKESKSPPLNHIQ